MSEPSKKVLIVSYYWPPGSGPGVQRFLKMSKFFKNFGWKPIILTVKNGSYPSYDESLLNDIPDDLIVYRAKTIEPFTIYKKLTGGNKKQVDVGMIGMHHKLSLAKKIALYIRANFFLPDARKGWIPFAYKKALKIVKKENINVVVTTGPPHSSHFIGLKLKRKISLPWVADMRDPWVNNFFNMSLPRTEKTIRKERKYEDRIIKNADHVSVIGPGLKNEYCDRNKNIHVIYNGYDQEDIPKPRQERSKVFELTYVGNFLPSQNIHSLWNAIKELINENSYFREKFRINLTGNIDESVMESIKKLEIEEFCSIKKYVPHKKAVSIMNLANLLLFIVPKTPHNKLIITGKLFEYIATRSPILPIGPTDGDAAKILNEANRDEMIGFADNVKIKDQINYYFKLWEQDNYFNFKHPDIKTDQFSRKEMTRLFTRILLNLTKA